MSYSRRRFIGQTTKLLLAGAMLGIPTVYGKSRVPIGAIAFDAFPIFDPRPIFALVKKLYPEQGNKFAVLWRTRIFEYTWLRTSANQYQDFWHCIDDALVYTARQLKIELTPANHQRLMDAFLSIKAYPDVKPVLSELKSAGVKLAFLSNMTDKMLNTAIANSGLEGYFDHVLSTDRVKTFKPDPKAYKLAVDAFKLQRQEIAFAAFASWDATGAKWYGYPTVWVNRLNFQNEELGENPDAVGNDLTVLKKLVLSSHK